MFLFNSCLKGSDSNTSQSQNAILAQTKVKVTEALKKIRSLEISELDKYADSMLKNKHDKKIFRVAALELLMIVNNQMQNILNLNERRKISDIFIANYKQYEPDGMEESIDSMERNKRKIYSKHKPTMDSLRNDVTRLNLCLKKLGEKEVDLESYGIGNIDAKIELPDDRNNNNNVSTSMRQ